MKPRFSGVFVTVKDHACVYTVCTEGELFYAPIYKNGNVNTEEFDFVDFWNSEYDADCWSVFQSTCTSLKTGTQHPEIPSGCPIICSYKGNDP